MMTIVRTIRAATAVGTSPTLLFIFLVICTTGGMAFAGESPEVQPGLRVRATIADHSSGSLRIRRVAGILAEATDSAFVIRTTADKPPLVVMRGDLLKLEERVRPIGGGKGALIGLGVGAGLGAIVGFASGDDDPGSWVSFSAEEKAGVWAMVLGSAGALFGLAAGRAERWQPVEIAGLTLGLANPVGQSHGLAVGLRF